MGKRLDESRGLGDFEDDLRVIVDYEVQILRHMLRDRLEWDLCSPLTPESFAAKLCADLGLTGEAQPLISNSVREQLINHKRAALELGLVGNGRVLDEKQKEMEAAWADLHAEKLEKQRRKLERGDTNTSVTTTVSQIGTEVNSTRESSAQPANVEDTEAERQPPQQNGTTEAAEDGDKVAEGADAKGAEDEDEEDVETLHLTATATAVPTREGTSTPALQLSGGPGITATRSSARLSQLAAAAASPTAETPPPAQPKLSATQRLNNASYTVREILTRGPRPLEGIWRDWNDSREFGPLMERLNDDDLEKLEEANIRASRRNRREAQRASHGRRRR
ncbi:SNF5-domain-containing protein [Testicularia cyperi]|uniref:SNF5-domain-containing protein n=1 Tax=Testicularia cyperi TaxID=1882483 RepID=A0A317XQP9_9BASI|nr:SNF5-domain-containing protein [Testicularia cyperi]